jgi:transposase
MGYNSPIKKQQTKELFMNSIPNNLWNKIKSLIPKKKSRVGRPEISARKVLNGIFFILKSGAQWSLLPKHFGSKSTVHGKFMRWSRAGIFEKILAKIRDYYLANNQENIWYAIDANHAKAPFAYFSGKSPVDRGKRGVKKTVLVDRKGAPLVVKVGSGNIHDSQFFAQTIASLPRKEKVQILVADSAYDCKKFRKLCSKKRIAFIASTNRRRKKNIRVIHPSHRWIVERTFGWFAWLRGLKTCWTKTKIAYQALCSFAASIQLFRMV